VVIPSEQNPLQVSYWQQGLVPDEMFGHSWRFIRACRRPFDITTDELSSAFSDLSFDELVSACPDLSFEELLSGCPDKVAAAKIIANGIANHEDISPTSRETFAEASCLFVRDWQSKTDYGFRFCTINSR
jgi:hypothetical protein